MGVILRPQSARGMPPAPWTLLGTYPGQSAGADSHSPARIQTPDSQNLLCRRTKSRRNPQNHPVASGTPSGVEKANTPAITPVLAWDEERQGAVQLRVGTLRRWQTSLPLEWGLVGKV